MSNEQVVADGWHRVYKEGRPSRYTLIANGYIDGGIGMPAPTLQSWGYSFEPAVVLTATEYASLRAELAEARKWVPPTTYSAGQVSFPLSEGMVRDVIEDTVWDNVPEESEEGDNE